MGASQCALASRLSDRLNNIQHVVGQKYKSLDDAITRFKNKEKLAWQKQMDITRVAIEHGDFITAENALQIALDHAKTFEPNDYKLVQTIQLTASCHKQHSESVRNSLPLALIPPGLYEALSRIADKSKDFITALGVAISVLLLLWLVGSLGGGAGDLGIAIAFKTAGFKVSIIAIFVFIILGVSYWILSSINEVETQRKAYAKYQAWADQKNIP